MLQKSKETTLVIYRNKIHFIQNLKILEIYYSDKNENLTLN